MAWNTKCGRSTLASAGPAFATFRYALSIVIAAVLFSWLSADVAAAASPREAEQPVELVLFVGESRLLETAAVRKLAVGLPDVAAVQVISPQQVLLNGVSPGSTNLLVWDNDTVRSFRVNVLPRENELIARRASQFLGDPAVRFRLLGKRIFLEGAVTSTDERALAESVARTFADDVSNNLVVRQEMLSPDPPAEAPARPYPRLGETGTPEATGTVKDVERLRALLVRDYPGTIVEEIRESLLVRGNVADAEEKDAVGQIARLFADNVVNVVRVRPKGQGGNSLSAPESAPVAARASLPVRAESPSVLSVAGRALGAMPEPERLSDVELAAKEHRKLFLARLRTPVERVVRGSEPVGLAVEPTGAEVAVSERADAGRAVSESAAGDGHLVATSETRWEPLSTEPSTQETKRATDFEKQVKQENRVERIGAPAEELGRHLARYQEFAKVSVSFINSRAVLEGDVSSEAALLLAGRIAALYFAPEMVVNLLRVSVPTPEPTLMAALSGEVDTIGTPPSSKSSPEPNMEAEVTAVREALRDSAVLVRYVGRHIVLEGKVRDEGQRERATTLAETIHSPVLNLIVVDAGPGTVDHRPIQVKVRVLEVESEALRQLGVDWASEVPLGTEAGFPVVIGPKGIQVDFDRFLDKLDLLERDGRTRMLAEPNLVTLPGQPASFLSGGQIPVPVEQPGRTVVDWKDYGVKLTVTPIRNEDGSLTVSVAPEISSLDWGSSLPISGGRLPAMRTTKAETLVTVPDGGTLVLAGLVQSEKSEQAAGLPHLYDVPVIGQLFGTSAVRERRTEVVIVVTASTLDLQRGSAD